MAVSKLDRASAIAIVDCMGAKKKERILVISDVNKREVGLSLFDTACRLGYSAHYHEMQPLSRNGEEPPAEVAELMKRFDIIFCPTTTSLTHTNSRLEACAAGARIATFPGITTEIMIRGLNADYNAIAKLSVKLQKVLQKGKIVRVTSAKGTDITFSIEGRRIIPSTGLFKKKGEGGNLPTGETYCAPVEGTANGVFIVDGSMAGLGLMKDANITIEVKDGYAVKVYGSPAAKKLDAILAKVGKDAYNIAEFGIGTNGSAKLSGVLLEDEKVLGTIHIALGNNKSMGGSIGVPLHVDGLVKKPTVYLDGKPIMINGKLLVTA